MCGIVGIVSARRAPLARLLGRQLEMFVDLARERPDGWGMANIGANGNLVLVKEPARPERSLGFRPLMNTQPTDAAILRLRTSSSHLPATWDGTQPFCDRDTTFAYGGTFSPARSLDTILGLRYLNEAEGRTDSERFFLAARQRLHDGVDPAKALIRTADDIRELSDRYDSLNCLPLTGGALYA